jgi:hypothetical protein
MAAANVTTIRRPGEETPALAAKIEFTRYTILGRYTLIAEARVPTQYRQGVGTVPGGENKGKAAEGAGKLFTISKANAKAVLWAVAVWDLDANSQTNYPSHDLLADRTGLSLGGVNKVARILMESGWLWKTPRGSILNSKYCHLNWDLIEAARVPFVPRAKNTGSNYQPPPPRPVPTQSKPRPQPGRSPQPASLQASKPQPGKAVEPAVFTELVQAARARLDKADPGAVKVPVQLVERVLRNLTKESEPQAILKGIKDMKNPQWDKVATGSRNPGGFMTTTLRNSIQGVKVTRVKVARVRQSRPKGQSAADLDAVAEEAERAIRREHEVAEEAKRTVLGRRHREAEEVLGRRQPEAEEAPRRPSAGENFFEKFAERMLREKILS